MRQLCAELDPEDGIDPRRQRRKRERLGSRSNHKQYQLCGAVFRAVSLALEDSESEVLRSLMVRDVLPGDRAGPMRVVVAPRGDWLADADEILALLRANCGRLREDVARSVERRYAPQLVFEVQP